MCRRMLSPVTAVVVLSLLAAAAPALAADDEIPWKSPDEGLEAMRNEEAPGVLFLEGPEGDPLTRWAVETLFLDKYFRKGLKKVVAIRVPAGEGDDLRARYDVPEGEGALLLLDFQAIAIKRPDPTVTGRQIAQDLSRIQKLCAKKGKLLVRIRNSYDAGEKLQKKEKLADALGQYRAILAIRDEMGEAVITPLFEKADERVAEIRAEGMRRLDEAQDLVGKGNYAKASSLTSQVMKDIPEEQVLERARQIQAEIRRIVEEYGGGGE